MSNSNYSIRLQRVKPVHTAYRDLHNLAENWSWARNVNGRDRDETETLTIFLEMRPRRDVGTSGDRDVKTETTNLKFLLTCFYLVESWHKEAFKEYEEEDISTFIFSNTSLSALLNEISKFNVNKTQRSQKDLTDDDGEAENSSLPSLSPSLTVSGN